MPAKMEVRTKMVAYFERAKKLRNLVNVRPSTRRKVVVRVRCPPGRRGHVTPVSATTPPEQELDQYTRSLICAIVWLAGRLQTAGALDYADVGIIPGGPVNRLIGWSFGAVVRKPEGFRTAFWRV